MRTGLISGFALAIAVIGAPLVAAENWPEFRGPSGDGMSTATGLPVTWSESENIAWKTPIHGKAWSSPVIWDDQIWKKRVGAWRPYTHPGGPTRNVTLRHLDHVHVSYE